MRRKQPAGLRAPDLPQRTGAGRPQRSCGLAGRHTGPGDRRTRRGRVAARAATAQTRAAGPCCSIWPMARAQTIVQLNDTLLALLDQRAAQRGVSRSQIIREAIETYLAADHQSEITRQILAGYERVPQSTVDEWGGAAELAAGAARAAHRRLDAEERAAGKHPW